MEIDQSLQLAMLLTAFLAGVGMGIFWEAITATRILLGAYRPPDFMRARYARELPLLRRSVPFARKSPLGRAWRHLVIALGDCLFCLCLAIVVILILYRYNDGVWRLSVPVLALMGLALFRFVSVALLAPVMAYFAYGFAAAMLYLGAPLRLPLRALRYLLLRLILRPLRALHQKCVLSRARRISAALCAAQLTFARAGFEGEMSPKERMRHVKAQKNTGKNRPRPMGDNHFDSPHFLRRHRHRRTKSDGDQPKPSAH